MISRKFKPNSILYVLIFVFAPLFFLNCASNGHQIVIQETPTHQAIAYGAGKAVGIAVVKLVPSADFYLQEAFDRLMERNASVDTLSSEEVIAFFSECVAIMARHTSNPYGLIEDLSVLLLIFGAQYDAEGNLTAIDPVPKSVVMYFGMGYDSGISVAQLA